MANYKDVNGLIGVIHRHIQNFALSQVEQYGITPPQLEVLQTLWKEDGITMSELGRRVARDGPTITGITDRMEKKNLVTRKRTILDRRIVRIYSTPRSWEIKEELMKLQQEVASHITVHFTDDDLKVLDMLKQTSQLKD